MVSFLLASHPGSWVSVCSRLVDDVSFPKCRMNFPSLQQWPRFQSYDIRAHTCLSQASNEYTHVADCYSASWQVRNLDIGDRGGL